MSRELNALLEALLRVAAILTVLLLYMLMGALDYEGDPQRTYDDCPALKEHFTTTNDYETFNCTQEHK